jgi:FdrA protein
MSWQVRVIRERYVDSMRLMKVAHGVRAHDGVARAEVAMGTAANLEMLGDIGVRCDARPMDVVIAVDAPADVAAAALDDAERDLGASAGTGADRALDPPRALGAAARTLAGANVALISIPGEYATLEAHRGLSEGLHVFLFSDHVSAADELALKRRGVDRGLLVMGPECGTAMLGDVGLGFANVVRQGPVGIVAAAGTGAQEAAVLLDAAAVGVSNIIGVGGRDLSAEIGGIMFREAMRMLAADARTETLLLVSKPPDREVVERLGEIDPRGKRVVAAFVGWDGGEAPFEIHPTLEAAAFAAADVAPPALDGPAARVDALRARRDGAGGRLLALYSGGSLAHEAVCILRPALGGIGGNAGDAQTTSPSRLRRPTQASSGTGGGHVVVDFGEEEYTRGRPHPMVDLGTRLGMLESAATDDGIGCVLLDVVLGHGSHPDPAGGLAPALERLAAERPVIAHVCGTAADPQDAGRQEATLRDAGVVVAPTNAAAARLAARAIAGAPA